jgi:hypothetical protein
MKEFCFWQDEEYENRCNYTLKDWMKDAGKVEFDAWKKLNSEKRKDWKFDDWKDYKYKIIELQRYKELDWTNRQSLTLDTWLDEYF